MLLIILNKEYIVIQVQDITTVSIVAHKDNRQKQCPLAPTSCLNKD